MNQRALLQRLHPKPATHIVPIQVLRMSIEYLKIIIVAIATGSNNTC